MPKKVRRKRRYTQVVSSHLKGIKRALLDGDKRPAFLEFLKRSDEQRGLYALYDKRGRLYYAGKALDLRRRLDQHLKDKHSDSWDQMSLFFLDKRANVGELEGLLIATAKPKGNTQKPKTGTDLKKQLRKFLKEDAVSQIDEVIYPEREEKASSLSGRITPKKLKKVSQGQLAKALGISQGRVSQLVREDRKNWSAVRAYIRGTGRRDAVLLLLEKRD